MAANGDKAGADLKQDASDADLKRDASEATATEEKATNGALVNSGDATDSPYFLVKDGNSKKDK